MNITEVRVKLMRHRTDRLRAFCSITVDDDFVVHDLRVIEGRKGLFVAMPSRKLSDNCPQCSAKNELRARFCGSCGSRLDEGRAERAAASGDKYHVDVAHPINTPCREMVQNTVLAAYEEEERRAREGLEPLHEYSGAGLDDLETSYFDEEEVEPRQEVGPGDMPGPAEAQEEPGEPSPTPPPGAVAPGRGSPTPSQWEGGPEPGAANEVPEPEPEGEVPPGSKDAEAPEGTPKRSRSRPKREGGAFGEGIF